ncbi:MAG: hypothetical protein AAF242_02735 [Bacteroidota bacterium]
MASNSAITAKQRGGYDPVVQLADGSKRFLSDLMTEIYNQNAGVVGVKENLTKSYTRTVTNNTDNYLYSPGNIPQGLLEVPTLDELGFVGSGWRIDILAFASMRATIAPQAFEVRLVDAIGNAIIGSINTDTVGSTSSDTLIKTTKTEVAGGTQVAFDFKRTVGAAEAQLYNVTLLIQVVRV